MKDSQGLPKLGTGGKVSTAALIKVANGEQLTNDERSKNDVLAKATKEDVIDWFKYMISKQANIFKFFTVLLCVFFLFTIDAQAQRTLKDGGYVHYPSPTAVDTLTASDTIPGQFRMIGMILKPTSIIFSRKWMFWRTPHR